MTMLIVVAAFSACSANQCAPQHAEIRMLRASIARLEEENRLLQVTMY